MPTQQQLLDAIAPRLEPAEQVFQLVLGRIGEEKFDSVVALTSRRLLLSSPTRGSSIPLGNIKAITWSGLWSSLNIDLRQPAKRIVVGFSGSEWKQKARDLVEEAKSLIVEAEK
jgi:ABC-type cobalamin transport system permease subunit